MTKQLLMGVLTITKDKCLYPARGFTTVGLIGVLLIDLTKKSYLTLVIHFNLLLFLQYSDLEYFLSMDR